MEWTVTACPAVVGLGFGLGRRFGAVARATVAWGVALFRGACDVALGRGEGDGLGDGARDGDGLGDGDSDPAGPVVAVGLATSATAGGEAEAWVDVGCRVGATVRTRAIATMATTSPAVAGRVSNDYLGASPQRRASESGPSGPATGELEATLACRAWTRQTPREILSVGVSCQCRLSPEKVMPAGAEPCELSKPPEPEPVEVTFRIAMAVPPS